MLGVRGTSPQNIPIIVIIIIIIIIIRVCFEQTARAVLPEAQAADLPLDQRGTSCLQHTSGLPQLSSPQPFEVSPPALAPQLPRRQPAQFTKGVCGARV